MELVERFQSFRRDVNFAQDPNLPWYRQRKTLLFLVIGLLVLVGVAVLFFGGYFAGLAAKQEPDNLVPEPESRVVLPPVEWDGICPKRAEKCPSSFQGVPPLILVSLDGFRPDFMNRGFTPTIKNVATCGVHTPYMFPVFPTKTFPNHYSQVTGLFPPYHGIVDNNMYDPFKKKLFKVGTPEMLDPSWWQKEPIWVTAQKQGKISGCYYWPGSEVAINGTRPTHYKKYSSKVSFESRVDQVLSWLDLPEKSRPHFITLYVNEPDHALHAHGTTSKQTNDALSKVDRMIERLFSGLQQRSLLNCVNVVIMSDHGMADINCKHVIELQNYISVNDSFITAGPFARIRPKGKRNATIVKKVVNELKCKSPHMRTYPKEQLPVRMHFVENPRIEPIFVDIDSGWTVVSRSPKPNDFICSGGAHGYDNMFPDMRAIFLAYGPSFKRNITMQPFLNIEVYEMLAELIGIVPNPNNGTRGSMHYIMTSPNTLPPQTEPELLAILDVPSDMTYDERISASTCVCDGSFKQLQPENLSEIRKRHMPFGTPHRATESNSAMMLSLLLNEDYVNAFSFKFKIPVWSSFTLQEQKENKVFGEICWKGDARIPSEYTPKCKDFKDISDDFRILGPLYPPGFSDSSKSQEVTLITNSLLKSLNYSNIIEKPFNEMLSRWVSETGELNVVIGPAFDIHATGVKPNFNELTKLFEKHDSNLISTHIFVVVTWCSAKTDSLQNCHPSKLQSQGYLLPNEPFPINCLAAADLITKNVARVADIEKLTGLSFYMGLPIYDAIRLRVMMPERSF